MTPEERAEYAQNALKTVRTTPINEPPSYVIKERLPMSKPTLPSPPERKADEALKAVLFVLATRCMPVRDLMQLVEDAREADQRLRDPKYGNLTDLIEQLHEQLVS